MAIAKAYAVMNTGDLPGARLWYEKLFGRAPDLTPMAEVHEWYFGDGGVQLLADAHHAGKSRLTLIVDDIGNTRSALAARGLELSEHTKGDFATVAEIKDPDGNIITFAEPGPAQPLH